jgi:hypothetical protein
MNENMIGSMNISLTIRLLLDMKTMIHQMKTISNTNQKTMTYQMTTIILTIHNTVIRIIKSLINLSFNLIVSSRLSPEVKHHQVSSNREEEDKVNIL